jgi:cleavage and polyadenylation specificity factor subunit 1
MAAADIAKTAIITPFGLFEYLFMPFGLSNAAQTFQRLMDRLFRQLPFVFTYLDDHLIASRTLEEHLVHLGEFFQVLQTNGLTINPAKCVFAATALKFLGHLVNEKGIQPLPRHLTAIQEFPPPTDLKQLQRYLGMVNFYRRFLPGIARVLQPLTDLLRGSPKVLTWPPEAAVAFAASKQALVSAVPLSHPAPNAVLSLATDASDTHVGGVLQQLSPRGWQPLAFFSKKLTAAEVKYSTFDRELLGAFLSIRHFRFLLEGRVFRLLTDHKPLVAAMTRVSPPWSAWVQRQLAYISEFTSDVRHIPGLDNVVADTLSRPPTATSVAPVSQMVAAATAGVPAVDMELLAAAQQECPEVGAMRASASLSIVSQQVGAATLYGDVSTGKFRPLLPPSFRQAACEVLHGIHHPGVKGTVRLVCQSYCWPGMAKFVNNFARQCLFCQKGKIHRHVSLTAAHIPVPIRRFAHIHVDIVGPLPVSNNNTYLFTILDRTTRWPEAVPMSGTTAATCAEALLAGWIQRFGVPSTITSDRGPQFTSALWAAVCSLLNIAHLCGQGRLASTGMPTCLG